MNETNEIKFGALSKEGVVSNIKMIKQSDILKCPHVIMVPSHYREDGSCKCNDPKEQAMMIKEWGYKKADFKKGKK